MTTPVLSDREKTLYNISQFSQRFGIQITVGAQRDRFYQNGVSWSSYPEMSASAVREQDYILTVSEFELNRIAETQIKADSEERMRRHYPAVQDAWEKYQMLLALYS